MTLKLQVPIAAILDVIINPWKHIQQNQTAKFGNKIAGPTTKIAGLESSHKPTLQNLKLRLQDFTPKGVLPEILEGLGWTQA